MFPFIKSFHHFKLRCGLTQKRGGEQLLSFFPLYILKSEFISSNNINLFPANITVRTASNSIKKLYWLFTKEIIALDYLNYYLNYFFIATHILSQANCNLRPGVFTLSCFFL